VPAHGEVLAEMTCTSCHATSPLNPDGLGRLGLEGLPERYQAGRRYVLSLRVEHPAADRQRWGFEVTAVDAGTLAGAGRFEVEEPEATQVIESGVVGRQYVAHTEPGTALGRAGGTRWTFAWVAPEAGGGEVAFYAAVNAANGDGAKEGLHLFDGAVAARDGPGRGAAPRGERSGREPARAALARVQQAGRRRGRARAACRRE
jgi:hypothetical protein